MSGPSAKFEPGDMALFNSVAGPVLVKVIDCKNRTSYCNVRVMEPPTHAGLFGRSFPLDSVLEAPKFFLSHYQKPLRKVLSSKKRRAAIQDALEEAIGQYAGPSSWANIVREYNGSSIPRGAEAAWSNGRKGEWIKEGRGWKYSQEGGDCGCGIKRGGYRATRKNSNMLAKWRRGESIGFTGVASLKAKGLIPRTSRKNRGKKIVGPKYR